MIDQVNAAAVPEALIAFVRLANAHAAMQRAFNQELQAAGGITVTDFEVLRRLVDADGGRMRRVDLAYAAGVTASGMTRLLEGLERGGLVMKAHCTEDHRVTYAVITDTGRQVFECAARTHLESLRSLFEERFTEGEITQLIGFLGRLPGAEESCACPGIHEQPAFGVAPERA